MILFWNIFLLAVLVFLIVVFKASQKYNVDHFNGYLDPERFGCPTHDMAKAVSSFLRENGVRCTVRLAFRPEPDPANGYLEAADIETVPQLISIYKRWSAEKLRLSFCYDKGTATLTHPLPTMNPDWIPVLIDSYDFANPDFLDRLLKDVKANL